MSHLRAKFQQTSGQRLHTSHHFPAQFQNILARQAGTAAIIPMSKKMFQSCLHRPPYPPPPAPVSPSLLPGGWKQLKERAIKTDWYLLPALSCERRWPYHCICQVRLSHSAREDFSSLMFTSGPSPPLSLAAVRYRVPGGVNGDLGTRCGRAKPSHEVRRGTSLSEEGEGYLSEAITNFSPLSQRNRTNRVRPQRHKCAHGVHRRPEAETFAGCASLILHTRALSCRADPVVVITELFSSLLTILTWPG